VAEPFKPSPPPTPTDSPELRVKKFEELYALAKSAFRSDTERLSAAEEKASRYLSVLALVLGLNAAGFHEFIAHATPPYRLSSGIFLSCYIAVSVCNGLAVWHLFHALAVTKVFALPVDQLLLDHFWSNKYEDAIYGMTRSYLDATGGMRKHVDAKLGWVRLGFRWLSTALILSVICIASFTVMKAGEKKMTDNDAPNQAAPTAPAASDAAPGPSDSASGGASVTSEGPNPAVTGPKFVQLDRGEHGKDSITKIIKEKSGK
jgi:hypothetical protein